MMYRNKVRFSGFSIILALTLFSASAIAGGSTQKRAEQSAAKLMTAADAIPDVVVVLKKRAEVEPVFATTPAPPSSSAQSPPKAARAPKAAVKHDEQAAAKKKTNKDGSFSFENVPLGTYNLTFDAPKVSPAMGGKVEYLVIVQQIEAGAGNSATKTYDESKPRTARIPIAKIQDGLDFTVGPQPPGTAFQASKSNGKNRARAGSQVREPKQSPQAMNLRGKIFLVEIGTTRIVRDQPGVKAPDR